MTENKDDKGLTPLHLLCRNEALSCAIIKRTVELNLDLTTIKDNKGITPITYLFYNNKLTLKMLELFVGERKIFSIDIESHFGVNVSPVMQICANRSFTLKMLQLLVNSNIDLTIKNEEQETPLHCLCMNEALTLEMLQLIGYLKIKSGGDKAPLQYLFKNQALNQKILQWLLEQEIKDEHDIQSKVDLIKKFLSLGADINYGNKVDETPLFLLLEQKNIEPSKKVDILDEYVHEKKRWFHLNEHSITPLSTIKCLLDA